MLKGENIIVFSSADWKISPSSPQHISTRLAKENKVLFVETFGSRPPALEPVHMARVGRRLKNWLRGVRKIDVEGGQLSIYSPINLMVNFRPFLFINKKIFLAIMRRLLKRLDFTNPILYFYLPPPPGIIGTLGEKAVIYHCVDEWLTFPGGKNKIFLDAEKKLTEGADMVVVANECLFQKKQPSARRIHKIYHGVDSEHYAQQFSKEKLVPEEIKNIPHPIIAVIGNFADWMDTDLMRLIAQAHKDWSIVSIGPIDSSVDISSLKSLGNVYFFGQKDYSELPLYYRAIDVFIIPFLLTEHIKSSAPIRLYEHLTSGKPVVSIDFPAVHEIEEGLVYIASDKEDFIKKIERALEENNPSLAERRKSVASKNTWESKVEEISALIEKIIRKKKVLHLITRLNAGGAQEIALSLAAGLDKNRFEVTFASGPQDFCKAMADKWKMKAAIIPDLIRPISPLRDLVALARLYFFMKKNKFDIVHTHTSKAGILGRIAAKLAKVPIIFHTPHGSIFHPIYYGPKAIFLLSRIENFASSFTDTIITCAENERQDFLEHRIGSEEKYRTIYYGIRQDNFLKSYDRALKRREFGIQSDAILIGNIARLVPEKGHFFCLEALRMVADKFPDVKLLIVGDGKLRRDIENKIKELNLGTNVVMAGHRNDIAEILASVDISLHTSSWEGTPIAIIEAMLMRKAIIATKVGGIPELISDGEAGILIPPNDKKALWEAIMILINDRLLAKKMGENACRYAKEKFNINLMIDNVTRLYDDFFE